MAKLKMADYTGSILIEPPRSAWGIQTVKIGEAGLFPGYPVTATGETLPEVVYSASADDVFYGILLENSDEGIETEFSDGDLASCLINGSRGSCWTWLKANEGSAPVGTRIHTDAGTGRFCIIAETALWENVGLLIEYTATDASDDRPVKVVLT